MAIAVAVAVAVAIAVAVAVAVAPAVVVADNEVFKVLGALSCFFRVHLRIVPIQGVPSSLNPWS